ncbi:hypothetical protein PENTCL1PPCAC_6775 [Pristionchus entomophagus]|uniref:Trafficking protein particle complex subunit 13 n=1 Tax=Pristionchus entomophagus TaxID=358040 RepID=A0AAV5SWY6_9BILA|nr:hypothetical protein PENTCL1PPCAC_6775 [Pristionchus entomophagus]
MANMSLTNSIINPQNQEQLISLKVMRLSRGRLAPSSSPSLDHLDVMSLSIEKSFQFDLNHHIPLSEYLLAPMQFENIFLGETFSFLVNCINESEERVKEVAVKVELQTSSQRIQLNCGLNIPILESQSSKADVISHEVKEAGQHILVCSVTYQTEKGENLFMRKFFKFPVNKPMDVKTKLYNGEENAGFDVFLEAQIENISGMEMRLERVWMDSAPSYSSVPLQPQPLPVTLANREVLQVVFGLSSKIGAAVGEMTKIGRLDMEWKTRMGERGRLQTSHLERIVPGRGDLTLKIDSVPSSVESQKIFPLQCTLHNCCDHSLDLRLQFDPFVSPSLVFCSPSGIALGQIPPKGTSTFTLHILPVNLAFQAISGIRVLDSFSKRVYEFDDIAQIFVY